MRIVHCRATAQRHTYGFKLGDWSRSWPSKVYQLPRPVVFYVEHFKYHPSATPPPWIHHYSSSNNARNATFKNDLAMRQFHEKRKRYQNCVQRNKASRGVRRDFWSEVQTCIAFCWVLFYWFPNWKERKGRRSRRSLSSRLSLCLEEKCGVCR